MRSGGTLLLSHCVVVGNTATATNGNGGGIYFAEAAGGYLYNSVITGNNANNYTGGVYLEAAASPGTGGVVVSATILAKNTAGQAVGPDALTSVNRIFTSGGNNRLTTSGNGFTGSGDYVGTVNYVVTGLADTFNHNNDSVVRSVREAIDTANITAGTQEIWLPAWKFVLTRERTAAANAPETDISQGDLEISDTLTIRGVNGATSVAWRAGAAADRVFELLGDYDRVATNVSGGGVQYYVDQSDWDIWYATLGSTTDLRADGDDDGVVDEFQDEPIWDANFHFRLTLFGVL